MTTRVTMDPVGLVRKIFVGADELIAQATPQHDLFVLAHVGIPRFELSSWRLEIGGLVERPRAYSYDEMRLLPARTVESFHQCAGFPKRPDIATRRIGNVRWTGVDLGELLDAAGVRASAKFVIARGSFKVMARATDVDGALQPLRRARNAVHAINVRTK